MNIRHRATQCTILAVLLLLTPLAGNGEKPLEYRGIHLGMTIEEVKGVLPWIEETIKIDYYKDENAEIIYKYVVRARSGTEEYKLTFTHDKQLYFFYHAQDFSPPIYSIAAYDKFKSKYGEPIRDKHPNEDRRHSFYLKYSEMPEVQVWAQGDRLHGITEIEVALENKALEEENTKAVRHQYESATQARGAGDLRM